MKTASLDWPLSSLIFELFLKQKGQVVVVRSGGYCVPLRRSGGLVALMVDRSALECLRPLQLYQNSTSSLRTHAERTSGLRVKCRTCVFSISRDGFYASIPTLPKRWKIACMIQKMMVQRSTYTHLSPQARKVPPRSPKVCTVHM